MAGDDRTRTDIKSSPAAAAGPAKAVETDPTQLLGAAGGRTGPAPTLPLADAERWERGQEIARGGMGRILAARDRRLGRPVAIKELLRSDPGLAVRLEREALITARLQHPSIVSLYELGRWASGEPFYAMKLVAGRSFKVVLDAAVGLDGRLALIPHVVNIADALAYAHSQRIIHRDLKPANVLVGDFGETVVIDWGLAKDLARAGEDDPPLASPLSATSTDLTEAGSVVGTPAFMPPEQAAGDPVDERSDVYALGAILYHVLAGKPPYADAGVPDVLSLIAQGGPTPIGRLVPTAPPELAAIAVRAMARAPAERYPSARELAEELRRFQTGRLVTAHRYTRGQLVRRWLRRNRTAVAVALSVIVAGASIGGVALARVVRERARAAEAERRALERADRLTVSEARAALERDPLRSLALVAELSPGSRMWGAGRTIAADAVARGVPRLLRAPAQQSVLAASRDGRRIVSAGADGAVRVWDAATGAGREVLRHDGEVNGVALSPDGGTIVSWGADDTLRLWDGVGTRVLAKVTSGVRDVKLSADGHGLFLVSREALLRCALPACELTRTDLGEFPSVLAVSPDGTHVAVGIMGLAIRLLDLSTGTRLVLAGHTDPPEALAFSPDGKTLASASSDKTVRLWDVATGAGRVLAGHTAAVSAIAFSPDGKLLASAGADRMVRLWTVADGSARVLDGHLDAVTGVVFSPDGTRLASAGRDRTVRVWDVAGAGARVLPVANPDALVAFAGDGRLAAVADTAEVRVWDLPARPAGARGVELVRIAADPARPFAVASDVAGELVVFDLGDGHERVAANPDGDTQVIALAPGGRSFATLGTGQVRLWDDAAVPGPVLTGWASPPVVFSPDGGRVAATGRLKPLVLVWDLATRRGRALAGHTAWVEDVAFSGDGRWLVSGSRDHTVRLWDLDRDEVRVLEGHTAPVRRVVFSADGALVASSAADHTVRLWRLATGVTSVLPVDGVARALAFSPDGRTLAAGDGKVLRLWDTAGGGGRALGGHESNITRLVFSADGRALATGDEKTVRLWDVESGEARTAVRAEDSGLGGVAEAGGRWVALADRRLEIVRDDLPRDPEALRRQLLRMLPAGD